MLTTCLLLFLGSIPNLAAAQKPNILFIAVDDLRPAMGCYGDSMAITPNMDRLAERSVLFNRAYCQVAVCNPSRASLMTGLRPDKLGVWTLPIHFREAMPNAVTMPQWFRKHGYTAVSHGKIYHNPTPDPQSWSESIRELAELKFPYPEGTKGNTKQIQESLQTGDWRKNNLRHPSTAAPDFADNELVDGARTDLAIEDLRRLGKTNEPFFLAMGYIRPHLAWVAPKKYWDMHDPQKLPVVLDAQLTPNTPRYAMTNNSELTHYSDLVDLPKPWDEVRLSPEKARHMVHGYYACVSYIDAQIGRLLKVLEEEGLAENTIIVLWSDHGWKLGEMNAWGKMTNYEIDSRVPLLISAPGVITPGSKSNDLVELLDLFPTLCELADIQIPDFVDGTSIVANLKDTSVSVKSAAYSQYYRKLNGDQFMGYAIRTDQHRFVEWRDFESGKVTATELYDHQVDHLESLNIGESAPKELIDELTDKLLELHPRKPLQMTPAIHSAQGKGRLKTAITFSNRHSADIYVFKIMQSGKRLKKKNVVEPKEKITLNARVGDVFVVESRDGKIHEIHSPSYPARSVEINSLDLLDSLNSLDPLNPARETNANENRGCFTVEPVSTSEFQ